MTFAAKDANGATVQLAQPVTGPGLKAAGTLVTLPTDSDHARTGDIAALQSALITALGLLATDQDVMATNAKLEAIRLLLASPVLAAGAAADSSVQAITTKLEAVRLLLATPVLASGAAADTSVQAVTAKVEQVRALLAGTLAISAQALPLPLGAAKDATLTQLDADLNAGLGADGTSPPTLPGGATGVRGWLRYLASLLPASLGAKLSAASLSIVPASDASFALAVSENHLGEIGGNSVVAVGALTRQANTTAYAAGQAIQPAAAIAIPLALARKNGGTGRIARVRLTKSSASLTNASFRVHLFKSAPATLPADATAFTPSGALDYIGAFPITMSRAFSDGAKGVGVPETGSYVTFDAAVGSTTLYALLEAAGAYTPVASEVFTVAVEADRD